MKFALCYRSISEEAACDAWLAAHFVRKRQANCNGKSPAHYRIAAVESKLCIEQVHRSAAAPATTFLLNKHLRHHGTWRHASCQCMAVLAIRGHDRIVAEGAYHAHTH